MSLAEGLAGDVVHLIPVRLRPAVGGEDRGTQSSSRRRRPTKPAQRSLRAAGRRTVGRSRNATR